MRHVSVNALLSLAQHINGSAARVQARFELDACALVAPHVHPRGTELLFVYEGEVTLGWSEENGGRIIENSITAGNSGFVPQGLINWVQARRLVCLVEASWSMHAAGSCWSCMRLRKPLQ